MLTRQTNIKKDPTFSLMMFSRACMPSFIALGCLEVGEKFSVGGGGGVGAFRYQQPSHTN